ncbi:MAG: hypothetical protein CSA61_00275 [Neptuniibacter caesariensis]|uniref:Tetratricopeptide repeat-like domain-containing protein n=1 Tax=Neptuniibacter caesariensis TaxID=207954 RepID=A0A2G6JBS1_NEPCE|nr:MAG: hypothetical protein CSA61_00275 [Neptuniibacter caesariensis]
MVQIKKGSKGFLVVMLIAGLAGCVTGTGNYRPPVEDRGTGAVQSAEPAARGVDMRPAVVRESRTERSIAVPVPTPVTKKTKNPAVIALLDTANRQKRSGAMRAAESSLERAQRIAPRDPDVYYQWADVRRLEGRWLQAEQLALKGTNMAIGDAIMLRRLWLLIATIRSSSGDPSGAQNARDKAMSY